MFVAPVVVVMRHVIMDVSSSSIVVGGLWVVVVSHVRRMGEST